MISNFPRFLLFLIFLYINKTLQVESFKRKCTPEGEVHARLGSNVKLTCQTASVKDHVIDHIWFFFQAANEGD